MSVKICARALLYDKSADIGLTGQMYKKGSDEKGVQFIRTITVPLVDYASNIPCQSIYELSEAQDGQYLLQLMLPDGNIITKDFEIKRGQETVVEVMVPHEGPHEWSSLHAMKGFFKGQTASTQKGIRDFREVKYYADFSKIPDKGFSLMFLQVLKGELKNDILGGPFTIKNLAELIKQNADVQSAIEKFGEGSRVNYATQEDEQFSIFEFPPRDVIVDQNNRPLRLYPDFARQFPRYYILQQSASGGVLRCLPLPWRTYSGDKAIQLLLDKDTINETPKISLTVEDPMMNSILGYINAGAIHQALEMTGSQHAKEMLYEKLLNPFAAAIGGYLLIIGTDSKNYFSESDKWKKWISNLYHWFEWLPDGAVLFAALHFVLREPNREKAYEALMRAYEVGLPVFTYGLKLMMDGMRYYAREDDAKARECLNNLEIIAEHTDPSQPFLSVTFANHWKNDNVNTSFINYG